MQWFRLYDDLLDDPKCQQLSPALFKHWINLLCLANKETPRGTLPDVKAIAFRLRLSQGKATAIIGELVSYGLIDRNGETLQPHNWAGRQRASDDVAERVRRHRGNGSVTLHETPAKLSGATESDTEPESEAENTPPPPKGETRKSKPSDLKGFAEWYGFYPRKQARANAEAAWSKLNAADRQAAFEAIQRQISWPIFVNAPPDKIPHPATWLNARRWEDEEPQIVARALTQFNQRPGTYNANQLAEMARNGGTNGQTRDDEAALDTRFRLVQ